MPADEASENKVLEVLANGPKTREQVRNLAKLDNATAFFACIALRDASPPQIVRSGNTWALVE